MTLFPAKQRTTAYDIVAVASSAGGINALTLLLKGLPYDFPAALVIVQHLHPQHRSLMAQILSHSSGLHVKEAEDGELIVPGVAYIAVPNRHMLVSREHTIALSDSKPIRYLRPSADVLFEAVAIAYQSRAVAVVLSGTGTDGSKGIHFIKRGGGMVIAQDRASSEYYGMPSAAIDTHCVDYILALTEIAPMLNTLVTSGVI